jgi:hypothetical protein
MDEILKMSREELTTRAICGDPKAEAWLWIQAYADSLGEEDSYYGNGVVNRVTAQELVEVALINVNGTSSWGGKEYLIKGGLLEGIGLDPLFWDKFSTLRGEEVPVDMRENFFSCSC